MVWLDIDIRPTRTLSRKRQQGITCDMAIYQWEGNHSMMAVGSLAKPGRTSFPETKCSGTSGCCWARSLPTSGAGQLRLCPARH